MRKEHWYLNPRWTAIYKDAVIAERARIQETVRFRIGELFLTLLFRPWRLRHLFSLIFSFIKPRKAEESCFSLPVVLPTPPMKPVKSAFPSKDLSNRLDVRELWRDIDRIQAGLSYRLGTELIQMRGYPWRLILLPVIIWRLAHESPTRLPPGRPASEGVPQLERAVPHDIDTDTTVPASTTEEPHGTTDAPSLTVVGPDWLMEMLAYEEVLDGRGSAPIEGPLLICFDDSQQNHTLTKTLVQRLSPDPNMAAWVIGTIRNSDQIDLLNRCRSVFVLEPDERTRLSELLSVKVSELLPFVQPRTHNPIGYWNNSEQGLDNLALFPGALQPLINLSRGINKPSFTDKLSPYFRDSIPSFTPPGWMHDRWAQDYTRAGYIRWALTHHALSNRLDEVKQVFSQNGFKAESCLASAVITTMRPDSIEDAVAGIARQNYPCKEIVLVLHGDGFNLEKTKHDMADLDIDCTVLTAPGEWTLGEALQKGCESSRGDVIFKIDDDDWYSENYLADQMTTLAFSDAGVVGKNTRTLQFVNNNNMYLMSPGFEYRFGEIFGGCTFAMRRAVFKAVGWRAVPRFVDAFFVDDCLGLSIPLFSGSKFNFVYRRNSLGGHTWSASEKAIIKMYNASSLPDTAAPEHFNLETG